jgi:uncharacterized protein (TIGR03086 family)
MTEVSERFRRVADGFAEVVAAVPPDAWSNPSPCAGWDARDVVRHLAEWLPGPGFLLGAFDVETGPIPSVDAEPAAAWSVLRDAIQAALEDPETAGRIRDCGPPGRLSFETAVEMTCIPDVLIHTWDLAQAAGVQVTLDARELARQAAAVAAIPPELEAAMRSSGHFGQRLDSPEDAEDLARVLAFYGRRAPGLGYS